ncbi:hypothetical protein E0K89_003890 [Aquicoccus sp. SCR17]|nr:hypothetical protein [Carideicomes alvinocaridis]
MTIAIRPAGPGDIDRMTVLLLRDAEVRYAHDPVLWAMAPAPRAAITDTLRRAMGEDPGPVRQTWLVAVSGAEVVGTIHAILLPVPPIYAGAEGAPGLIMEDSIVAAGAPDGTGRKLLEAAERDLAEAGARILLGASVPGGAFERVLTAAGYTPLTLYYAKSGLDGVAGDTVRAAAEADVRAIVELSAQNRRILHAIDRFWRPHAEADARFDGWMRKSLTLGDRDMLVADPEGAVEGYAIAQPAGPLHIPPAHDIRATGFIDDFYHLDLADTAALQDEGHGAAGLLGAAEAALAARGKGAALVVCPAGWASKRALLEAAGYEVALEWHMRRLPRP